MKGLCQQLNSSIKEYCYVFLQESNLSPLGVRHKQPGCALVHVYVFPLSKFSQHNERVRLICAYCHTRMESGDVLTFFVCVCPQMVKTTGGPAIGGSVSSPAMTNAAVTLLQDNLSEEERQLWTSLGPNWTLSRLDFVTRSVFSTSINNIFVSVCLGERAVLKMTFDEYSYSSKI